MSGTEGSELRDWNEIWLFVPICSQWRWISCPVSLRFNCSMMKSFRVLPIPGSEIHFSKNNNPINSIFCLFFFSTYLQGKFWLYPITFRSYTQAGIFTTEPPTKNCTSNIIFIVNKAPRPCLRVACCYRPVFFLSLLFVQFVFCYPEITSNCVTITFIHYDVSKIFRFLTVRLLNNCKHIVATFMPDEPNVFKINRVSF